MCYLSIIVTTGVYALLLKFLQKNSPHNVQTKGGGGQRPFEQCSNKLHFSYRAASLSGSTNHSTKLIGRDFTPQAELEALATEKPEIASTYLLGKSVQVGRWLTLKLNLNIYKGSVRIPPW